MENDIVKKLTDEITSLDNKILDYIESTENWIFYWIDNKEVQNFVEAYPEEYEFMAHVSIKNISVSPLVCIYFDEHPDGIESIERYGPLYYFRETANANWLKWNGKIKDLQRLEIKKKFSSIKKELQNLKVN